ncbi:MAG: protein kinase, partial [Anaerolineales bacterium]
MAGRIVKGYKLQERIGVGGFGAVYRALQTTVDREVAVKIILPGFTNNPDFIRRFEAEAQLIARLEHLHIAPLYDYWRDPEGAYLVMRYLRGGNLRDALRQGPLDLESAALLIDQVSSALALAHSNDIIHRDIKPENILLDEDGNAYLADFGIAKDVQMAEQSLADADSIVGSPDYIAPEQARKEPVMPRTDIYSLGIVLYEVLAGHHPFPDLTPVERLFKHINEPVPLIDALEADVSAPVNKVIQKATAKDPEERYSDVRSFASAFREAAGLSVSEAGRSLVELLTPREQEVLRLMIDGRSNREIADELVIEVSTVKWYTRQIYRKLNVRSRVQAIVKARELNLIFEDEDLETAATAALLTLPEPENPYRGLRAFQVADERYFFGREGLTRELLAKLGEDAEYARFLAVVGPSGSGKSSLVKAGLIPALWRGELPGSERWFVVDMVPGAHPLDELEVALMRIAAQQSGSLMEHLERDARGLVRVAQLILPDDESELVIVIDQFEELFTLVDDEDERLHVLDLIRGAVTDPRSRVRVAITLRADFYDRPLQYPEFGALVQQRTETVLPLTAEELERAIQGPANAVGVKFEEGLVASISQDVHYQPGGLPLMQYALTELFEQREDHRLTHAAYESIGGSVGALPKRIEEIYLELDGRGQEVVRQMFLRLVTLGEGVEDTRRRVPRSELLAVSAHPDLMDEMIDTYTANRLLSLDNDPATRSPTVELAHEAILREWNRLRSWLAESRADIRLQRSLASAAIEWRNADQEGSYLLRGVRLTQYEQWAADTDIALTELEKQYLRAGLDQRQQEEAEEAERQEREQTLERRARRVLVGLLGVFLVAAVVSGGLAISANSQRVRAEEAEQEALKQASIGLAAQAIAELDSDTPDRGVILALEALENYPYTPQAERALAQTVYATRLYTDLTGYQDANEAAAFSPDGSQVALTGGQYDAVIWDITGGSDPKELGNEYIHSAERVPHVDVAWSPDGSRLATVVAQTEFAALDTGLIKVWDAVTGEKLTSWTGHSGYAIWSVDWSADIQAFFTAGGDGLVKQWGAGDYEVIREFNGHTEAVLDVKVSPDGSRLATASEDGTIRIWEVSGDQSSQVLSGHLGAVNAVAWSSDGSSVASAGDDGLAILWDVNSSEVSQVLRGHLDAVHLIDWSADDLVIATAGEDGTTRIW